MNHQVFVSYSAMDKPVAEAICQTLERRGIGCWIAPRDVTPGQDWSEAIIDAIAAARLFLLILSSNSNVSEQVKREVQNAVSETKILLPLRVEDVALSKHMRYFIGTPHWLDAIPPPIGGHLERIAGAIEKLLGESDEQAIEDAANLSGTAQVVYAAPAAQPAAAHAQPPLVSAEQAARVEALLGPRLGVVSSRVVKKTLSEASGYDDLCRRVAEHISNPKERSDFLAQCGPAPQAAKGRSAAPTASLTSEQIKSAGALLARHIGPMASVLVKRAARDARSVEDFHARLAAELSGDKEKREFLGAVKAAQ